MSAQVQASDKVAAEMPSGRTRHFSHAELNCAHSTALARAAIAAFAADAASAASFYLASWAARRFAAATDNASRRLISSAHAVAYRSTGGEADSIYLLAVDALHFRCASCHVIPCAAAAPAGEQYVAVMAFRA